MNDTENGPRRKRCTLCPAMVLAVGPDGRCLSCQVQEPLLLGQVLPQVVGFLASGVGAVPRADAPVTVTDSAA